MASDSGFISTILHKIDWGFSALPDPTSVQKIDLPDPSKAETVHYGDQEIKIFPEKYYLHPLSKAVSRVIFSGDSGPELAENYGRVVDDIKTALWRLGEIFGDAMFKRDGGIRQIRERMWQSGRTNVALITMNLAEANKYDNTLGDLLISTMFSELKGVFGENMCVSPQGSSFVIIGLDENIEMLNSRLAMIAKKVKARVRETGRIDPYKMGFQLRLNGMFAEISLQDILGKLLRIRASDVAGSPKLRSEVEHIVSVVIPKLKKVLSEGILERYERSGLRDIYRDVLKDHLHQTEVQAALLLGIEEVRREHAATLEFSEKDLGWRGVHRINDIRQVCEDDALLKKKLDARLAASSNYVGALSYTGDEKGGRFPISDFLQRVDRLNHEIGVIYHERVTVEETRPVGLVLDMIGAVLTRDLDRAEMLLGSIKSQLAHLYDLASRESNNRALFYAANTPGVSSHELIWDNLISRGRFMRVVVYDGDDFKAINDTFFGGADDHLIRGLNHFIASNAGSGSLVWNRAGDANVVFQTMPGGANAFTLPLPQGTDTGEYFRSIQRRLGRRLEAFVFQPTAKKKYYTFSSSAQAAQLTEEKARRLMEELALDTVPEVKDGIIYVPKRNKAGAVIEPFVYENALSALGFQAPRYTGELQLRPKVWIAGNEYLYGPDGRLVYEYPALPFTKTPSVSATYSGLDLGFGWNVTEELIERMLNGVDEVKGEDPHKGNLGLFPFVRSPVYSLLEPRPTVRAVERNVPFAMANIDHPLFQPALFFFWDAARSGEMEAFLRKASAAEMAVQFRQIGDRLVMLSERLGVEPRWLIRMMIASKNDSARFYDWISSSGQHREILSNLPELQTLQKELWDVADPEGRGRSVLRKWVSINWDGIDFYPETAKALKDARLFHGDLALETVRAATPSAVYAVCLIAFLEKAVEAAGGDIRNDPFAHLAAIVGGQEIAGAIEQRALSYITGKPLPVSDLRTAAFIAQKFKAFGAGIGAARIAGSSSGEMLRTLGVAPDSAFYYSATLISAVAAPTYLHTYLAKLDRAYAERGLVSPAVRRLMAGGEAAAWAAFGGMAVDVGGYYLDKLLHTELEEAIINEEYERFLQFNREEGIIASSFSKRNISFFSRLQASADYLLFNIITQSFLSPWLDKKMRYLLERLGDTGAVRPRVEHILHEAVGSIESDIRARYIAFIEKSRDLPYLGGTEEQAGFFADVWNRDNSTNLSRSLKELVSLASIWGVDLSFTFVDPLSGRIDPKKLARSAAGSF